MFLSHTDVLEIESSKMSISLYPLFEGHLILLFSQQKFHLDYRLPNII